MLQNAYLLAKIGADTAQNEQHFAEICRDRDADGVTTRASRARRAACPRKNSARLRTTLSLESSYHPPTKTWPRISNYELGKFQMYGI